VDALGGAAGGVTPRAAAARGAERLVAARVVHDARDELAATSAPIETAYHGKPWRKFVVPSSGSTTNASSSPRGMAGS
jgi:hypothetical protein